MNINQPFGRQLANNDIISNTRNNVSSVVSGTTNALGDIRKNINSTIQEFSSKSIAQQGSEFIQSNSIVAKFAFLLLVLILFMVLFKLGTYLLNYFLKPNMNPYLVKGLIHGTKNKIIPQDPNKSDAITLYRSNNETTGMEFTWSVWLNMDSQNFSESNEQGKLKHIFSKGGNGNYDLTTGIMLINNAPGLYLDYDANSKEYKLKVIMSTVSANNVATSESVEITSIPINQWFNVMIRLENKIMDVYMNGVIVKRLAFTNVPKQNYDDVFVCGNGGFSGSLSDLRYFNRSLNIFEINSILYSGPNLKSDSKPNTKTYDYLSSSWYSRNI